MGLGRLPVVIVVPGSLGLQAHHLAHASTITDAGIAACAIDPFGPRNVVSTVDNQIQYSFAASAWDVLATAVFLADRTRDRRLRGSAPRATAVEAPPC